MNHDEFAFFNQQLGAMVRDGIPLESALRRLCTGMRRGHLRGELEKLQGDLAQGRPLREAAAARQLPDLYKQMLEVGAQSNNLPAVLTMLADYYQRRHLVWTRLKGLLVYPVMVLFGTFLLSCFLAVLMRRLVGDLLPDFRVVLMYTDEPANQSTFFAHSVLLWAGPIALGLASIAVLMMLAFPPWRQLLRWRLSPFREDSYAQAAAAFALMLKNGVSLDKALTLMERLETGSPAAAEYAGWRRRLASGQASLSGMAADGKLFPPLFIWTVSQAREDLPAGFQQAADSYQARSSYRTELMLYSVLPCSVLLLGMVLLTQLFPIVCVFLSLFRLVDGVDF